MVIVRSPLRISLGGGGTDLKSYYQNYGGFLIAGAIDRYVYISISRPFKKGFQLKYSQIENVDYWENINHPIIKETLNVINFKESQLEISSFADIPAGTGLGSSGSFTTALIKGLYTFTKKNIDTETLAELACYIEIDRLQEPVGKQDQYISAVGGLTCFTFDTAGKVTYEPLNISSETIFELEDNLLLFFTGFSRSAGSILKDQKSKTEENNADMIANLHFVKDLGVRSKEALENGDTQLFGELMHQHWEYKKRRSGGMSNPQIDEWYKLAIANGAVGGKLVGAGGGGFLMFMANDRNRLRKAMLNVGLEEVRFKFDFEGTKVLHS